MGVDSQFTMNILMRLWCDCSREVNQSVQKVHFVGRLSELWYFNRKNKRPVHDLTPSICNMFAMCTSCREKREYWSLGEIFSVQHAFRSEVSQDYGYPSEYWLENAYHKK